jgi:branched-chain amino acid transport system permease protein
MDWGHQFSFWCEHGILLGVWVTLALSLNLINGCTGLFSLGHQGFWAVGAYAAALLVPLTTSGPSEGYFPPGLLPFLLSFPVAMLGAALFGLLVGLPCLRMRGDYLAIATLGFAEILRNVANNTESLGKAQGLQVHNVVRETLLRWQGWSTTTSVSNLSTAEYEALRAAERWSDRGTMIFYLLLSWGVVVLTLIVLRNLMKSGHGRAVQAIRDDETAAELLGVNLTRYKVLVFVLGAALAGLAGAVFANYQRYVSPEAFNFMQGVTLVAIVVLGGLGSFTGTVLAACVIYLFPVLLSFAPRNWLIPIFYDPTRPADPELGHWIYQSPRDLWQVFFALMLILVVLLRPQGLLGRKEWPVLAWLRRAFQRPRGEAKGTNP